MKAEEQPWKVDGCVPVKRTMIEFDDPTLEETRGAAARAHVTAPLPTRPREQDSAQSPAPWWTTLFGSSSKDKAKVQTVHLEVYAYNIIHKAAPVFVWDADKKNTITYARLSKEDTLSVLRDEVSSKLGCQPNQIRFLHAEKEVSPERRVCDLLDEDASGDDPMKVHLQGGQASLRQDTGIGNPIASATGGQSASEFPSAPMLCGQVPPASAISPSTMTPSQFNWMPNPPLVPDWQVRPGAAPVTIPGTLPSEACAGGSHHPDSFHAGELEPSPRDGHPEQLLVPNHEDVQRAAGYGTEDEYKKMVYNPLFHQWFLYYHHYGVKNFQGLPWYPPPPWQFPVHENRSAARHENVHAPTEDEVRASDHAGNGSRGNGVNGGQRQVSSSLPPAVKPPRTKIFENESQLEDKPLFQQFETTPDGIKKRQEAFLAAEKVDIRRLACRPIGEACGKKVGDQPRSPCVCRGCTVKVQDAIITAVSEGNEKLQEHICEAFKGVVKKDVIDPFAIFVITCLVEHVPEERSNFIAEAFIGEGKDLAKHKYGCRVLNMMVRKRWRSEEARTLIDEVLLQAPEIKFKKYATFFMQTVLEVGSRDTGVGWDWYEKAVNALIGQKKPRDLVTHLVGSPKDIGDEPDEGIFVIAKALKHCTPEHKKKIGDELLQSSDGQAQQPESTLIKKLTDRKYGCILLKRLLLLDDKDIQMKVTDQLKAIFEKKRNDTENNTRQLYNKLTGVNGGKSEDSSDCDAGEQKRVEEIVSSMLKDLGITLERP